MSQPPKRPIVTTFALIGIYASIIEKLCRIIVNLATSSPDLLHDGTGGLVVGGGVTLLLAMGLITYKTGQGSLTARRLLVVLQFTMSGFLLSYGPTIETYTGNISIFPDLLSFLLLFLPESTTWMKRKSQREQRCGW
jgi:hypothetical protein